MTSDINSQSEQDVQVKLEEFRLLYQKKYRKKLDDEILFIIIRINELNTSLINAHSKDITRLEKKIEELKREIKEQVSYRDRWDYFVHGLGKSISYAIVAVVVLIFFLIIYLHFLK